MFFVFFFQAEDGIRDYDVTGVQTCALPILAEDQVASGTHRGVDHPVLELAEIGMQARSDASGAKLSDIFEPHLRSGEPFLSELRVGPGDHVANAELPVQLVECGSPERAVHKIGRAHV